VTEIVVRLRDDAARNWYAGADASPVAALRAALVRHGVELTGQYPGASDPQLRTWFTVSTPSPERAEDIAASLRGLDAVDAAYVQPRPDPA